MKPRCTAVPLPKGRYSGTLATATVSTVQGCAIMSYLVFHMDKFKKEAVRGIQSHNTRERESHSNPDIDYSRSPENYELLDGASADYARAVQNRIDDLLLTKAVRKDAVHMCGLIVSSNREFFWRAGPEETKRFFEESKAFLTEFVGKENVISAMVHMDEKTPHMHFLHVPVTKDGRLNANSIYTRESLKILQTEFHRHLHSKGFDIQRGVEQESGSKKKHLNTREFKQQQEALSGLQAESAALTREALTLIGEIGIRREKEAALEERLLSYEAQAQEAEKILHEDADIPEASLFSFKPALEKSRQVIELQKQALASKHLVEAKSTALQEEVRSLQKEAQGLQGRIKTLETALAEEKRGRQENGIHWLKRHDDMQAELKANERFLRQPGINELHLAFIQEERQRAARLEKERKAEQERREREEREQARAREAQAQERERQQAQERASQPQRACPARGMGMGR